MCLILLAVGAHLRYPLIVAANRDEAYARPATPAAFWHDEPHIYGGRDLEQGGTWLALSRGGRFAAITNYRAASRRVTARSRGELTGSFLAGSEDPVSYLERVSRSADDYNGFSLIVGGPESLYFFSNHGGRIEPVTPGVHGLSNHLLDEPWPKVRSGKAALESVLSADESEIVSVLQQSLANRARAPDDLLPSTGVGLERERDLSPSFIAADSYGTRASTVVLVGHDGSAFFNERTFGPRGEPLGTSEARFSFDSTPLRQGDRAPA